MGRHPVLAGWLICIAGLRASDSVRASQDHLPSGNTHTHSHTGIYEYMCAHMQKYTHREGGLTGREIG